MLEPMAIVVLIVIPVLMVASDFLPPTSWLARALDGLSDTGEEKPEAGVLADLDEF